MLPVMGVFIGSLPLANDRFGKPRKILIIYNSRKPWKHKISLMHKLLRVTACLIISCHRNVLSNCSWLLFELFQIPTGNIYSKTVVKCVLYQGLLNWSAVGIEPSKLLCRVCVQPPDASGNQPVTMRKGGKIQPQKITVNQRSWENGTMCDVICKLWPIQLCTHSTTQI